MLASTRFSPLGSILAAPSTVQAGVVTGAFTVEAESPFGNTCSVTAPVTLTQGTSGGTFSSDAAGTTPVTSVPWTGGTGASVPGPHQATFYYRDTVAGAHTLTVASTGLTSSSTPLTVTAGPASMLGFSVTPASVSADNTFSSNVRYRWEYIPGSEFFVVWTDEHDTRPNSVGLRNRAFVVKLTRLLRF